MQPLLQCTSDKYCMLWVCICSVSYPARSALAPCCHLWLAQLYNIFSHCLINGTILEKKNVTEQEICALISFITFVWNISHSKKNERDMIKSVYWSVCKYPLVLSYLNEAWICSTDFRKIFKYQISWKSIQWEPSCSIRTDGRMWRN